MRTSFRHILMFLLWSVTYIISHAPNTYINFHMCMQEQRRLVQLQTTGRYEVADDIHSVG